jgi:lysophospholipase
MVEVTTQDGVRLRAVRWAETTSRGRGTVCLLQGRAEFIEKYFEAVTELRQRGFAVVAFDWRGQGRSGREIGDGAKGHVRSFADYGRDLEAIRAQALEPYMPKPHFALAHSMGAAVALIEARAGRLPFERLVAMAPMIELRMVRWPKLAARLSFLLWLMRLGQMYVPGGGPTSIATKPFPGNRLTTDPVRYARNAASAIALGEAAVGDPTISWINAAFRAMQTLADPRFALEVRVPTLVVAPGDDPVCATPAIERFAARLKAGHAIVLPGARHEILMERDPIREQFWAAFDAFVPGTRIPAPVSRAEEPHRRLVEAGVGGGDH